MSNAYVPGAFDPDTLRLMEEAFAGARDTLEQSRRGCELDDETRLVLLRRIIARAAKGERNLNRLTIYAINGNAPADVVSRSRTAPSVRPADRRNPPPCAC